MAKHNEIGKLGENIACQYLIRQGHAIVGRNIDYKVSEIDIISQKDNIIHFIEVKSGQKDSFYTKENMTMHKQRKLRRAIEVHLLKNPKLEKWQIDIAFISIDMNRRVGRVEMLWDQVLMG